MSLRAPWIRTSLRAALLGCVFAPGLASAAGNAPAYRVHVGDVIEIAVAGLPELRMRSNVQPDGAVSFPLLGSLGVAGLTPEDMRQTLQRRLSQKVYRQRTNDGREVLVVIQADEVSAAIVEYRPVYVNGDVSKPGELIFRPGMTARQAVALAGGVDIAALRSQNPAIDAANVKGEYDAAGVELAKAQARAARIAGELQGKDALEGFPPQDSSLPQPEMAKIQQGESDVLQARLVDYRRERDFLRTSITQLGERTAVLEKQQHEEEEGARADNEDLKHMIDLLAHGNVANPRVLEARRALLMSQTRALQVTDGLLQLKKQASDLGRQLQHFEDDRRTELLKEQEEAGAAVAEQKIKRDAALEKLNLLQLARSRLSVDDPTRIEIRLVREDQDGSVKDGSARDGSTKTTINGDFTLEPGDVLELAVKPQ